MEVCLICRIVAMVDKVISEYIVGRERWQRYGTIGVNMSAEEMWDGNR